MAPSEEQRKEKKTLKAIAQENNDQNPSQIGDPVSLKAETSNTQPTEQDLGAKGEGGSGKDGKKTLKETAESQLKNNKSALGDPVSLRAETSDTEPTKDDRGARGTSENMNSGKPKM